MVNKFIFDVDGTLTPSRQKIDEEFKYFLSNFMDMYPTYIVTGSDKSKTVEQLGEDLFNKAVMSFNCSGNEIWVKDKIIYKSDWTLPYEVEEFILELLNQSKFPIRTGNHIEKRNGSVNFSIVGRNANMNEREHYIKWDKETSERLRIVNKLMHRFENIDVVVGGETGIDIFDKGKDKSQAIEKIKVYDKDALYFFGDQIFENGNDYTIAMMCDSNFNVKSWKETFKILEYMYYLDNV
jgi:phosphomannomutase